MDHTWSALRLARSLSIGSGFELLAAAASAPARTCPIPHNISGNGFTPTSSERLGNHRKAFSGFILLAAAPTNQPSERDQNVSLDPPDLDHRSPNSGERLYK